MLYFLGQKPGMRFAHHHRILWLELRALGQHQIDLGRRTECKHLKPVRMACNHIERIDAYRAGRAENGDTLLLKDMLGDMLTDRQ